MDKNKNTDTNTQYEFLTSVENSLGQAQFSTNHYIEGQIKLIPNEKISPGKFKKHHFLVDTYEANSLTIRAVRKELFTAGNELFEDLEQIIECSCGKDFDLQFWKLCPYCGNEKLSHLAPAKKC